MHHLCLVAALLGFADENAPAPDLAPLVRALTEGNALVEPHDQVVAHLKGVSRKHRVKGTLTRVKRALDEPWSGWGLAGDLSRLLLSAGEKSKAATLEPLVAGAGSWLDLEDPTELDETIGCAALERAWAAVLAPEAVELELLERLSKLMAAAHAVVSHALGDLDEAERERLFAAHGAALEAWYQNHFPGAQVPAEQNQALSEVAGLLLRVDLAPIHAAGRVLARLGEPEFLDGVAMRLARTHKSGAPVEGVTGDVIAVVGDESHARVVLGGTGKTTYDGRFALIIDLGGDDTYTRGAVVDDPGGLVSAVVDIKGNDRYADCAHALGGVAVLVDRTGDDTYESKRFAQGAASGGLALLVDLQGDDRYGMEDYGQGFGFLGTGLLIDREGDDVREAWAFAQGASFCTGFGALVDGQGDDRYVADLKWPDVYGDGGPNVYHGASQGYSTGLRPAVPGGIAALVDRSGKDHYQAGNFSQGGAYYFSFGLLYDGGGDDENAGTRYSQGFGVHQAVGVRWDRGGNDRYATRCAANLGAAWDEGIGWFVDEAGDDVYEEQGSLALGGAANSAIAVFLDLAGKDRYASGDARDCQGGTGDSSYYGEPSLGVFFDLGGGADQYSRKDRSDGAQAVDPGVGVFVDSKEKRLEGLLPR